MQENTMEKIGTGCLIIIILVLIAYGGKYTTVYYTGKQYVVDKYVEALGNKNYEQIYDLIEQENTEFKMNRNEVINYYNYYYQSYKPLTSVEKIGWKDQQSYIISMRHENTEIISEIQVSKNKKNKWKVKFPFEYSELTIEAPIGAEVKINEETLDYNKDNKYLKSNILPGKYMLRVNFQREDVENYIKVIELPRDKSIHLPYKVGDLKINMADDLKVKISPLQLENINITDNVKDILVGEYEVTVFHPEGYIEPIIKKINIGEGSNKLSVDQYTLSSKGNDKLVYFMKDFYKNYNSAIIHHEVEEVSRYFSNPKDIGQFEEWYINNKDIKSSEVFYEYSDAKIDDKGNLNLEVLEIVNLDNNQENSTKQYKVVISWDVCINIMTHDWSIVNRNLKESIVAVKDYEDKWVQY